MSHQQIKQVGVVGAGQMGSGIAQVMAHWGQKQVVVVDALPAQLEKAQRGIEASLSKLVEKGVTTAEEKAAAQGRLRFETQLESLAECDVVIEAIVEDAQAKHALFQSLDGLLKPQAILASNTSSLPISQLATQTKRPSQVIGMHFMNPVPLMKLVEIIRGAQTSDETYQTIAALSEAVGKTSVLSHDYPGFISNRILMPMINEAIFALFEGVGSAQDIDTVMKLGMNHPMGPLQLADFIGLDTCLAILNVLYDGFKDPKYRPCPLLVQKVNAGYLGKKSGRGFYEYA